MRWHFVTLLASIIFTGAAIAAPLEIEAINEAQLHLPLPPKNRINPILIKAQVLLDRAHFSPGEIDGEVGDNFKKALAAFAAAQGLHSNGELTAELWEKLTGELRKSKMAGPDAANVLSACVIGRPGLRCRCRSRARASLRTRRQGPCIELF